MRPYFSDIKYIKSVVFSFSFWHNLNMDSPRWEISVFNVSEEIFLSKLRIIHLHFHWFFICETLDTLISLKVVFDVESFTFLVNPDKSMRTISVHVSMSIRSTSIWEKNTYLVERNWVVLPEIKDHVSISQVSLWVWFLRMDKIWEFHWVIDEKHWCVITD